MTNINDLALELRMIQLQQDTGLSARELAELPLDEYGRLTGRRLGYQPPADPPQRPANPGDPRSDYTPPAGAPRQLAPTEPEPIDFASMSYDEYAAFRQQYGIGAQSEYGRGIFSDHGSWADAAKAKAGRTAMVQSNVVEAPRIERFVKKTRPDTRSALERFSTPGNTFGA